MATKVAELVASLRLDAKEFSQGVKEAESKLTDFGKKATKTGRKLTMAVTLPMAGAAAGAIKAASDFETSMTKIQSMVGLSADTVQAFEKDVLRLSGETAQAPKELAAIVTANDTTQNRPSFLMRSKGERASKSKRKKG